MKRANIDAVDETFMLRAMEESDLNALRLALYQATGDESLMQMKVNTVGNHGGSTAMAVLAPEDCEILKRKVIAFVRSGAPAKEKQLGKAELRHMMEALIGRALSDKEFEYHQTMPAFEDFPFAASWSAGPPVLPAGFRVAIIGAGISGIATGVQFERLGIPYTIYERRHELGGTWSMNTYPDVRVDTNNFLYQYTFEKNYPWSEYFGRQADVRNYLEYIAKKYGVFDKIRFDCDIKEAWFVEPNAHWKLTATSKTGAETLYANVVIAASGLFGVPKSLNFPGVADFRGDIVHTAKWSRDTEVRNRRVAIIGNGSTGVQLLSKIAAEADNVTVFQRTPQWISPRERYGEPVSAETRWLLDNIPYFWNWNIYSMSAMQLSHQPLQEIDPTWQAKGGLISEKNDGYRVGLSEYIKSKLPGRPDLIDKVTPRHAPMARRLIVDNGWYTSLLRDNVELACEEIERLTSTGIRTVDGKERPFDLIVAATGFEATKYVWPMNYFGAGGASLHERWEDEGSPRAYVGITMPDFPNFFMHYGPNSQPRAGSLIAWQEIWARYSAQAVVNLIEGGHRSIVVKREVFDRYNAELDKAAENLVWSEPLARSRNYYVDKNGRSSVNASWRSEDYYQFFTKPLNEDYIFS